VSIPNLLAERYAGGEMRAIWSPVSKIRREREFWIAVLEAQRALGVDIPAGAADAYRAVIDDIDLDSISRRERRLRHDVMARLEEFCELAGCEYLHWGLTSRDLTENVEQTQIRDGLALVRTKAVAALAGTARRAAEFATLPLVARTHNVPAQATTYGRRFAAAGEELIGAIGRLEALIEDYPLRGLKGPVGTQGDLLELLGGDAAKVAALEAALAERLGFARTLGAVGQVYPRSMDFDVVSSLFRVATGPADLATTMRLMAGHELLREGFGDEQVGSSAMPHKVNARSCERLSGLATVLRGHVTMAAGLAGVQWNEGDVSCSVVRRIVLPDAFFAIDGVLETYLTILRELQAFPEVAAAEMRRWGPLMASSALLRAATDAGSDRSSVHALVQRHSLAAAEAERTGRLHDLAVALGADDEFPLGADAAAAAIEGALAPGRAEAQVTAFVEQATELVNRYPEAGDVVPEPLL